MKIILNCIVVFLSVSIIAQIKLSDSQNVAQESIINILRALSDMDTAGLNDFFLENAIAGKLITI